MINFLHKMSLFVIFFIHLASFCFHKLSRWSHFSILLLESVCKYLPLRGCFLRPCKWNVTAPAFWHVILAVAGTVRLCNGWYLEEGWPFLPHVIVWAPGWSARFGQDEVLLAQVCEHQKPPCFWTLPHSLWFERLGGLRHWGASRRTHIVDSMASLEGEDWLWRAAWREAGSRGQSKKWGSQRVYRELLTEGPPCQHPTHSLSITSPRYQLACCWENNTELLSRVYIV